MGSAEDDDAADELAPRHILEVLAVPELSVDFTDRVMGVLAPPTAFRGEVPRRPSPLPWIVAGASGLAALAATALLLMRPPSSPPAAPQPAPVVPTVADAPPRVDPPLRGHLVLSVVPAGAAVTVDGRAIAGPSPFVVTNLAPGQHVVAIEHEGYTPWHRAFDAPDGTLELKVELREEPAPVETRKPETAADPEPTPQPTTARPRESTAKPAGDGAPVEPKAGVGRLYVGTTPGQPPALVYIDGKRVGTTPIVDSKVTAGTHRVRWEWPDGRTIDQRVEVVAGAKRILRAG